MAKKTTDLQYESYSAEDAEADHKEAEASRPSKFLKIAAGKNVFRVIPGRPGKPWKRVVYKHFVDVPGAGTVSFTCPRHETKGKRKCRTCQDERKLRASGSKLDIKRADRISAQRKVIMNAISRADEDSGPKPLEVGRGIDRDMIDLRRVEDVDFVDPIKGVDLIIVKTGERMSTKYKTKEGKACPLHASKAVMKEWIDEAPELDTYVELESDEDIDAKLRGEKPDRDDDDRRPSRRRKDEDEDDEEDYTTAVDLDDDDDDDDDDEVEEIEI